MIPQLFNKMLRKKFHVVDIMATLVLLVVLLFGLMWNLASASEFTDGDFTIHAPDCDNCFQHLGVGERVWDGPILVYVNMDNSPLSSNRVSAAVKQAIQQIKIHVDIDMEYKGKTEAPYLGYYSATRRNTIIISFRDVGKNVLGRANLWWNWHGSQKVNSANLGFRPNITRECFPGVLLHELTHAGYVGHSDVFESIMSSTPYRSCGYQETLRLDDIKAWASLYEPINNCMGHVTSDLGLYFPNYNEQWVLMEHVGNLEFEVSDIGDSSGEWNCHQDYEGQTLFTEILYRGSIYNIALENDGNRWVLRLD